MYDLTCDVVAVFEAAVWEKINVCDKIVIENKTKKKNVK